MISTDEGCFGFLLKVLFILFLAGLFLSIFSAVINAVAELAACGKFICDIEEGINPGLFGYRLAIFGGIFCLAGMAVVVLLYGVGYFLSRSKIKD